MTGPGPRIERPGGQGQGGPTDRPRVGGAAPGEVHPEPRATSPLGGPLGPLVGPDTVRDAVEATLITGYGGYLRAVEESRPDIHDPGLVPFRDWVNQPGIAPPRADLAPRYTVMVPGTLGGPTRRGDGTLSATFLVRLHIVLWGRSWRDTDNRLGAYLVAARTCLLQNGTLGGAVKSLTWRGESVNAGETEGNHTNGTATLELAAVVDPVTNAWAGPAPIDPNADPVGAIPITGVHVRIDDAPGGRP